jgi:hypothetical protein
MFNFVLTIINLRKTLENIEVMIHIGIVDYNVDQMSKKKCENRISSKLNIREQ